MVTDAAIIGVGESTVSLTHLAMHRGAHLRSAAILKLSDDHSKLFYDTDNVVFSANLSGEGKNISPGANVTEVAMQTQGVQGKNSGWGVVPT